MTSILNKQNGGFPPIKYCNSLKEINIKQHNIKERQFASTTKNINIREIINTNDTKPVIDLNITSSELMDL